MRTNLFTKQDLSYDFEDGIISELFSMFYALTAYMIGAGSLFWLFLASAGFAPYGIWAFQSEYTLLSLLINLALVSLFAVQHTIMARQSFKDWWRKSFPQHLERATYVLFSGILMALILWAWQPIPGTLWTITQPTLKLVVQILAIAGFIYVLASSFITNHYELFGLRQAWIFANHRKYTPVEFRHHYMYRYSRHPMMAGLLVVFWAAPEMTATRFVLGLLLTLYVFLGIRFEERGLIREFGETYKNYRDKTGMFYTVR